MKKIHLLFASFILLFSFPLSGCTKAENELTVAEVTHSIFYAPQYIAKNLGFFEKHGLTVDFITTPGAEKTMAAMLGGEADIGLMGPEATVYVAQNSATKYAINFAKLTQRDGSFLVGREKIDNFTLDMLKGKTIIGGRKGGMPEMTLEYVLKKAGLNVGQNDSSKDVNVRTDVQFDVMSGVFVAGQSDFVSLFEPAASQVVKNGVGHIVASLGQLSGIVPYTAYSSLNKNFTSRPEILRSFVSAIQEGLDYVFTHTPTEIALAIQKDFISSPLDEIVTIVTNYQTIGVWAEDLHLTEENFEKLLDILELAGELTDRKSVNYNKIVRNDFIK